MARRSSRQTSYIIGIATQSKTGTAEAVHLRCRQSPPCTRIIAPVRVDNVKATAHMSMANRQLEDDAARGKNRRPPRNCSLTTNQTIDGDFLSDHALCEARRPISLLQAIHANAIPGIAQPHLA